VRCTVPRPRIARPIGRLTIRVWKANLLRTALLNPAVWFCVPLLLALVCILPLWALRHLGAVRWLCGASLSFVAISLLATAGWSWFFKDGLGPGFVPTTGLTAWKRFWTLFWIPLVIGGAEGVLILGLCRRRVATLRSRPTGHP
jgi:hypothetical protein